MPPLVYLRTPPEFASRTHRTSYRHRRFGRAHLLGNVAVQVVEHESDVAIDVPVQARGVDRLLPAGHAIGGGELIVEIDRADASGNLPCAPATAGQRERIVRHDAEVGRRWPDCTCGLSPVRTKLASA